MRIVTAGIAIIVVSIAVFGFTLLQLIGGSALDPQTKVPGSVLTKIDAPGRYYVWDNHWTMFDGRRVRYADDWPANAVVVVRDTNDAELEFVPDVSQSWSIGNNGKTSVGYFDIDVPTATTIRIDIGNIEGERIVTVSNRTMKQELWSRLWGFGLAIALGAVGVPVCLLGLLVRRRPRSLSAGNIVLTRSHRRGDLVISLTNGC